MTDTVTSGQGLSKVRSWTRSARARKWQSRQSRPGPTRSKPMTSAIPPVTLPLADNLPKPENFVESAYNFAEQLLASQRKFAEDVLHVTAPLTAVQAKKASSPQK